MKTNVARDSKGKIMWIKGRTDISPLTYREFREGHDMTSGSISIPGSDCKVCGKKETRFIPPFTVKEEEIE